MRRLRFSFYKAPIGAIYVASTGSGISDLVIAPLRRSFLERLEMRHGLRPFEDRGPFLELFRLFDMYFRGKRVEFTAPIDAGGTDFDRTVWSALINIPFGGVRSYKEVAEMTGRSGGARAVGRACARNPVPIIVPCHRVVDSSGGLGGYSAGLEVKRYLLRLEGVGV